MGIQIDVVAQDIFGDNGVLNEWADLHAGAIRSLTVSDMVHQLTARAGSRKIGWLRIFGHGSPGAQWVGSGFGDTGSDGSLNVHKKPGQAIYLAGGVLHSQNLLAQLQGKFEPRAIVDLHGCSVGKGVGGLNLCLALARFWNVSVRAGIDLQHVQSDDHFDSGYIHVFPNGRVVQFTEGKQGFVVVANPAPPAPPTPPATPKLYHQVGNAVTQDDWLSSIAQKHYKDMFLWPIIFDQNRGVIQNPNTVLPNMKIEIPPITGYTPGQLSQARSRGHNWN